MMMQVAKLKLFIEAGAASAVPPLGPILGQYGVNTIQFCKEFNDMTYELLYFIEDDSAPFILSVEVIINEDRTFLIVLCKPATSFLLRLFAKVDKGDPAQLKFNVNILELLYLAKFKFPNYKINSSANIIKGVARSIGIKIIR
jgi:large subunit ribosomal protein L11